MDGMKTSVPSNPYVGPRAIRRGEAFFGRAREIRSLYALLVAERIVLLHSPSGAGKSSLIQAGLIPAIAERFSLLPPAFPIVRVNFEPPLEVLDVAGINRYALSTILSLEESIPREKRLPLREVAALSIDAYLEQRSQLDEEQENRLLIFDQFEEILIVSPVDVPAKQAFFEQLGEALQNRRRRALFAIREDYMGELSPYQRAIPNRLNVTFRLGLLGPEAAKLAIQQPARNAGVDFKDETAQKLVDDLRRIQVQHSDGSFSMEEGPSVEPVQLQVVCYNLWQSVAADAHVIDESDLQRVGSVDQALANFYANAVGSVANSAQVNERILREWFDRYLITPEGVRSQMLKGAEVTEGLPNHALYLLENAYLLRGESRAGKTWIELSHDRLVNPVRQDNAAWFEKNLSLLQRSSILWNQQGGRSEGLLLRNRELQQAERESKTILLTPDEQVYLAACQKLRSQQELRRTAVAGLFGFSIVTLGLLIFALVQLNISRALQLGAQAEAAFAEQNFDAAGLYAYQSDQIHGNDAADSVLNKLPYEQVVTGKALIGHDSSVESVAWSKDGRLASDSWGSIIIWDLAKGQPAQTLLEHSTSPNLLAWSTDGRLASTSSEGIIIWDLAKGEPAQTLTGHTGAVTSLAWSADGRLASASYDDKTIIIWDLASGKPAQILQRQIESSRQPVNMQPVNCIAWSADGRLASGYDDHSVIIWDLTSGSPAQILEGGSGGVITLAWSQDGRLASGSWDNNIIIWDLSSGKPAQTLEGHVDSVFSLAWSADGRLASASADGTVIVWDAPSLLPVQVLGGHGAGVKSVSWSADGRLASGSNDNRVMLWNLSPPKAIRALKGHAGAINSLAWSPDDSQLASGSDDKTVIVWDIAAEKPAKSLGGHSGRVTSVAWSHDGQLASASSDKTVIVWDVATGKPANILVGHTNAVDSVAWSPDGRLASGSEDGTIIIWDLSTGKPAQTLQIPSYTTYDSPYPIKIAWSPDSRRLAATDYVLIYVWDLSTGNEPQALEGHDDIVTSLAWAADGRLASASSNYVKNATIILWDLSTGKPARSMLGGNGIVYDLAWSADGRLASAHGKAEDSQNLINEIILWNITAGQPAQVLKGHRNSVKSLAWSSDGRLASGSDDQTIKVASSGLLKVDPCDWINRNMTTEEWLDYQGVLYVYQPLCPDLYQPLELIWATQDPFQENFFLNANRSILLLTWKGRLILLGSGLVIGALLAIMIWLLSKFVKVIKKRFRPG